MTSLTPLFVVAVLIAALLTSVSIWAPRRLWIKTAAFATAGLFVPVAYASLVDLLSKPKPVELEWWLDRAEEATVLGSTMREGEGIFLWLQLDEVPEPRAYVLPWDLQLAEQLQSAERQAQEDDTAVRMRLPFERSWDDREPKFYAPPQVAPPAKDEERPPARRYRQPEQSA